MTKRINIQIQGENAERTQKQIDFLKEVFSEKTTSKVVQKCVDIIYKKFE